MTKTYELTKNQERKIASFESEMPTDEQFKAMWAKKHHGKETGWGMGKRDWVLNNMKYTRSYQMAIWTARVDCINDLPYAEKTTDDPCYNMGYYTGYADFDSFKNEYGSANYNLFVEKYLEVK